MSSPDRVAFVASVTLGTDPRAGQAALDAEAVSERLRQPDADFEVVSIDAKDDVAGQIDDYFADRHAQPPTALLFYASARVALAGGDALVVLDDEAPDTGDALGDIAAALVDSSGGVPVLMVLDLRSSLTEASALADVNDRLRGAARAAGPSVELALCVRSEGAAALGMDRCSPFTRAILSELDETDPADGLYADELVERVREHLGESVGAVFSYSTATESLPLLIAEEPQGAAEPRAEERESSHEEAASEEPAEDEPASEPGRPTESDVHTRVTLASHVDPVEDRPTIVSDPSSPPAPSVPAGSPAPSATGASPGSPSVASSGGSDTSAQPPPSVPPAPHSVPPARPSTPPTAPDVLAEGDRLVAEGDDEEALARFRKALALVGSAEGAAAADRQRARIYVRIGEAKLRQHKAREAIASLEKGLSLMSAQASDDPAAREVVGDLLKTLHGLHLKERDIRALHAVEERLLKTLSPNETVSALVGFGRSWLDDLGDPLRARERFEHVLALSPEHQDGHLQLLKLAEREGRSEDVLTLKRRLAEIDPDRKARALQLFDLGKEFLKRSRDDEAFDLLEAALDADPSSFEPLVLLSRLLGERQEWAELEGAYRRMLDRSTQLESSDLKDRVQGELHKRLGLLLLEHLEDEEGALVSLGAAVGVQPLDPSLRRSLKELALRLGRIEDAREHAHALVMLDPLDVHAHRGLFEVLVRCDELERAFHSARVLSLLGVANDRERAVYNAHKEEHVARPTNVLSADVWADIRSSLPPFADEGVELVAGVFRAAGEGLVAALVNLVSRAGRLPKLDEAFRVDPETSTVSAARGLNWAAKTLGIALPAVYLEDASSEAMTTVLRADTVSVIGSAALRGRSLAELSFLSGYHLSGHLPEHRLARLCPALDELAACFLAAVVVAVPDTPVPERIRSLVELLAPEVAHSLDEDGERALEAAVLDFEAASGRADLVAYTRAVERASLRAGLLLAGDLEASLAVIDSLPQGVLSTLERKAELLAFTVSDLASVLRSELGSE